MKDMITDDAIRAYEDLLEQSKLESYFRHHKGPLHKNYSKSSQEQEEGESEEEEGEEDSDNASTSSEEGSGDQDDHSRWNDAELDLLFFSLQRRGRIRCGLIAEDLGGSKSISQVEHLIHLFEREKQSIVKRNAFRKKKEAPIAIEVSNEWIQIEQVLSTHLQDWEENEIQRLGQGPFSTNAASRQVDWDSQVLNSILFLRHSRHLDPKQNEKNLTVKQTPRSTENDKVFSFTISELAHLLHNTNPKKPSSFSYRMFANDHCVPKIKSFSSDPRVWKIILGSIQFGYIVPINIKQNGTKADKSTMQAILNEQPDLVSEATIESLQECPEQRLVWWDSLPHTDDKEALTRKLGQVQKLALHQLLRSLKRKEMKQLLAMVYAESSTSEEEANGQSRKRKIVEDETKVRVAMRKKRKIGTGEGKSKKNAELWDKRMNRFDRIGVCKEDLLEKLKPEFNLEDQTLFYEKTINKIFESINKRDEFDSPCEKISLHVISTLAFCLRFFLYRIMEHITNQISHSLRQDVKETIAEITPDDIFQALALVNHTSDADHDQINFEVDLYERDIKSSKDQSDNGDDENQSNVSTDGDDFDVRTDHNQSNVGTDENQPILNVFEPSLSNDQDQVAHSTPLRSLIDVYDTDYVETYKKATTHLIGLRSLNESYQSANDINVSQSNDQKVYPEDPFKIDEAKEAKESQQENLIDEQDILRSQKGEDLLWSQLGIRKPEKLTYVTVNGNDQITTESEEAGDGESSDGSLRSVT